MLLRRLRATAGDDAVREVIRRSGITRPPSELEDVSNWMPYAESLALFRAAVEVTGDERIAQRVGEDTVRQHAGTPVATLFRALGSPQAVYEQLSIAVGKFTTVTELCTEEVAAGTTTVRASARAGFTRDRNMCLLMLGMLSQPTVLFGLPPAAVAHPECELRGDAQCRYVVTWDAEQAAEAADPERLVAALEAQLAAMGDRLENMYATARDLIVADDLDAALDRITQRAATAVRAPSYLLAVRTGEDHELRVHHRGLERGRVQDEVESLLAADATAPVGSRLVADVASATRHYGRIMAASSTGSFFPHERDLLEVYGRYAAAVLDTHTAMASARDTARRSSALLQLAQAVAAARTSAEVAQTLVETTPSVIECDRVSVFLWHEEEGVLSYAAATELPQATQQDVLALRIRPSDTPVLARLVENPASEALFFGPDSDEPYVQALMRQTGAVALVASPIVAQDRFYGILTASVTDRPARLRRTPASAECIAGVVAQAATALDNARLIETMAHQARHDNLTGLPGHRAFREALGALGDAPAEARLTLAAIDIDDFKAINDTYGHPVGDEALKHVARALCSATREGDDVFRVGGEEFAVLLHGIEGDAASTIADRLRLAVAASGFEHPLRVSIGLAPWDGETGTDALLDRADAALYAAKRAGKDRVVLSAAA